MLRRRLGELGEGGAQAMAVRALHEVYAQVASALRPGDVVVCREGEQPMYARGAKAVADDMGTPVVLELAEDVHTLRAGTVDFRRPSGGVVQLELKQVLMLSAESVPPQARVLQADPRSGVVVLEPLGPDGAAAGPAEIASIVDVYPRHHLLEQQDTVQLEPLPLLAPDQLVADPDGPLGRVFDGVYQDYIDACEISGEEPLLKEELAELAAVPERGFDEISAVVEAAPDGARGLAGAKLSPGEVTLPGPPFDEEEGGSADAMQTSPDELDDEPMRAELERSPSAVCRGTWARVTIDRFRHLALQTF